MDSDPPASSTVQQVQQGFAVAAVAGGATGCLYRDTCSTTPSHRRIGPSKKAGCCTFTLLLRDVDPDGAPLMVRLRRLLKYALRACGLRCREVWPEAAPDPLSHALPPFPAGKRPVPGDVLPPPLPIPPKTER